MKPKQAKRVLDSPVPERIQATGRFEISISEVVGWEGNPEKRYQKSDAWLEDSIRRRGILQPLACRRAGNKWTCVDGNRRLRVAKRLGMTHVPIIEITGDIDETVVDLNTTAEKWDQQTLAQYVAKRPDSLNHMPLRTRYSIVLTKEVLGADYAEFVLENTLTAVKIAKGLANYLGRTDPITVKKIAYWMARHKQTRKALIAMEMKLSTAQIWKAIDDDEPLKVFG